MDDRRSGTAEAGESILALAAGSPIIRRPKWVPLRFVGPASEPLVLTSGASLPAWTKSLDQAPIARWRVGTTEFQGTARRLSPGGPEYLDVVARFESRFGSARVGVWFPEEPVCYCLAGFPSNGMAGPQTVEALFDAAAAGYDRAVAANPLDAWLRQESIAILRESFRPGERVLEIGCGTGLETIPLAQAGIEVVAIDVSSGMLKRLEDKAKALALDGEIRTRKLAASSLETLVEEFGCGSFDGAFSDFGALNLDPGWMSAVGPLAELVRANGAVVLGIWNRLCLSEMFLYSMALQPRRALARTRSPVPPGQSRFPVPVTAFAPDSFLAPFEPAFQLESLEALPFLLPPYDFVPHLPDPARLLRLLTAADRRVRGRFPFNRLGDHFIARLRRTGT